MSSKPKFFLLDAGPIIELHKLELWGRVLDRAEICVPRVIAEHEAEYWVREDDSRQPIDTLADAEAGRLTVLDCDEGELRETLELFDPMRCGVALGRNKPIMATPRILAMEAPHARIRPDHV